MPPNKDYERQVQAALNSKEAQQMIRLIAVLVEALESHFAERGMLVNVSFSSQPQPGFFS